MFREGFSMFVFVFRFCMTVVHGIGFLGMVCGCLLSFGFCTEFVYAEFPCDVNMFFVVCGV